MNKNTPKKWLVLIHQLPPKPDALRVKIWRRLQQVGAVAVKQSVYVLPLTDQSREDFSWILKEINSGSGDGSIMEVRFAEGLNNDQVTALFRNARKTDYNKIITDASALLADWTRHGLDSDSRELARLSKLQSRFKEITAIDFFNAPDKATAEQILNKLADLTIGKKNTARPDSCDPLRYQDKTWVTRSGIFVDRMACIWLIRRFIDGNARIKFVSQPDYKPGSGEIRFDMYDAEFTHEGNSCSFEVMIERFQIQDTALGRVAEVIHDIDLKENRYMRSETDGFKALLTGLASTQKTDDARMAESLYLFENLYSYFQSHPA